MSSIPANLAAVRAEIAAACARSGRDPATVTLMVVTKTQDPEALPALRACGIADFGENRIEHFASMLAAGTPGDHWHYIGRIQSRQLPRIAPHAAALHSLCEPEHIERLGRACDTLGRRLPVYLQVNASGEAAKAGVGVDGLPRLLELVRRQPQLEAAGLMTMAPELGVHAQADEVRACFARLRELARANGFAGLSMGMSGDLAIAVEEGATIVRIGSRIFR